jgi:thiol-disulfide isomerase/thioredoxin
VCLGRKDICVKRSGLVLLTMVAVIAVVLWAGWHNLRERRKAMQEMSDSGKIVLTKDGAGAAASGDAGPDGPSPMRGKVAPGFELMDLQGKKVSLAQYKGRPVVVNFWATWCGPCKVEMPWFEEFRTKYAGQGLEVLGLADDADAGKDAIAKVATKAGVTYPILLTDGKVQKAYGDLDVLPMSFYVDRTGKVIEVTAGLGSKDELEARVKEVVAAGGS